MEIKNIKFDGSILIARITHSDGMMGLSLGETGIKRNPGEMYPECGGKEDVDFSNNITRLYFDSKESIYALVAELILLSAEQFENKKIIYKEDINVDNK